MLLGFLSLFLPKIAIIAIAFIRVIALLLAVIQVLLGEFRRAASV